MASISEEASLNNSLPDSDMEYQQSGFVPQDDRLDPDEFYPGDEYGDESLDIVHLHTPSHPPFYRSCKLQCLVIIPLVVGVVFACLVSFSNSGKEEPPALNGVALQEPPTTLDETCANLALKDGKEACMEACEQAECCDFPTTLPLSCLEGNQQTCLVYHASCSNLNADARDQTTIPSTVPPAPANLKELCSSASLKTVDGFTGCHEACHRAECCYEKAVGTCTHNDCAGYAPCLTLTATDYVHKDIPAVVNKVCASDNLTAQKGRAECRQACSHALCCFEQFASKQDISCLHEDTSFCSQYSKCDELESLNPVEATPEEIALTCKDDEDVPGHISLCELVCQKGACCFSDLGCDEVGSNIQCSNFQPCTKVYIADKDTDTPTISENGGGQETTIVPNSDEGDGEVSIEVTEEDIDAACEKGGLVEIVNAPDQETLCHQVCAPGYCCFEEQGCNDVDSGFCKKFDACARLFHTTEDEDQDGSQNDSQNNGTSGAEKENPNVDTSALLAACGDDESEDPSDVVNLAECETLCEQGTCCYSTAYCAVPDPAAFCKNFGYCDKLYDDSEVDVDEDIEDDPDVADIPDGDQGGEPVNEAALEAACGEGASAPDQPDLCENLCMPGSCCFDPHGCSKKSIDYCAPFHVCRKIYLKD